MQTLPGGRSLLRRMLRPCEMRLRMVWSEERRACSIIFNPTGASFEWQGKQRRNRAAAFFVIESICYCARRTSRVRIKQEREELAAHFFAARDWRNAFK